MANSDTKSQSVGSVLRGARTARNLSLEQMSDSLFIRPEYLDAIERDDTKILPGRIYALGFVRSYAKQCGLDSEALVEAFRALYDATAPKDVGVDLPVRRAEKSAPITDTAFALPTPKQALDLSKLPKPARSHQKKALPAQVRRPVRAKSKKLAAPARGASHRGWVGSLMLGMLGLMGLVLLGGTALRYSDTIIQFAQATGVQLRHYAESYRAGFTIDVPAEPPATKSVVPAAKAGTPNALAGETRGAPTYALSSDMRRLIDARQNQLLLRPKPVMVTRVLQNYSEQKIPDFIQDARIEIRASAPNWLQVEDENGRLIYAREMGAGTSFRLRCCVHYVISTRDGGTLMYFVNDKKFGPVGEAGKPMTSKIIYSLKLARAALVR